MGNEEYIIQKIGISTLQFELYSKLLELGPSTILELSEATKIPRSTIHHNVSVLISKKLIVEINMHKKRKLVAEDPEIFSKIIDTKIDNLNIKQKELYKVQNLVEPIISSLKLVRPLKSLPGFKVKYYEGREEVFDLYKNDVFVHGKLHSYSNAPWIMDIMPEVTEEFMKRVKLNTLESWDFISNFSAYEYLVERINCPNYHVKRLQYDKNLDGIDYSLYDGKTAIIQYTDKPNALVIENEHLYNHSLALFKLFWELVK